MFSILLDFGLCYDLLTYVFYGLVTMQAQKEAPSDMQCKDKFLVQSVKVNDGTNAKDINAEMVIVQWILPN